MRIMFFTSSSVIESGIPRFTISVRVDLELVGRHVFTEVGAENRAAVLHDVGADVTGHHDRDLHVRRVDAEVFEQGLGEALHRELRRAVGGVRNAGAERAQNPFTLLVLTRWPSVLATSSGHERAAAVVDARPVDRERLVPLLAITGDEAAATADAGVVEQQIDVVGVVLFDDRIVESLHRVFVGHVADVGRDPSCPPARPSRRRSCVSASESLRTSHVATEQPSAAS